MLWQVRQGFIAGRGALDATIVSAGSAWGDHGTNSTLSTTTITNDTVTGVAASFSSVRGTQLHSSGKYYFEIKILTAPAIGILDVGVADDTTANGAPLDNRPITKSASNSMFNGNTESDVWNGTNIGSGWSLVGNDVMAVAVDIVNGYSYLALNNVWFLSGDPTSGVTGTGAVGSSIVGNVYPMLAVWGSSNGLYQLKTVTFTYTPPSGYSAWG